MNNQLLRIVIVCGTVSVVGGCGSAPSVATSADGTWKCFTVNRIVSASPHAEENDKYCVLQRGGAWYLALGEGMTNWKPVGGTGSEIPLTQRSNGRRQKSWDFDVEVTGHPQNPHGPQHTRPNRGYRLTVNIPRDTSEKSQSEIRVVGDSGAHGGTAHGVEN